MRHWVLPIAIGTVLGCSPKGKPPSVPASLKSNVTNGAEQHQEKTVIAAEEPFQQGLPPFCDVRQEEGQSCVVCRVEDLPLERCFGGNASFDPQRTCTFDKHQLKCLITENLSVVRVAFQNSPEKQVLGNLPLIFGNIKAIVDHGEEKQPDEAATLFALLDFVESNGRAIIMGQHTTEIAHQMTKMLSARGNVVDAKVAAELEAAFVSGVKRLREQTIKGQLDDADGLRFVRDLALLFVRNEKTVHMLKTMSVDGLASING